MVLVGNLRIIEGIRVALKGCHVGPIDDPQVVHQLAEGPPGLSEAPPVGHLVAPVKGLDAGDRRRLDLQRVGLPEPPQVGAGPPDRVVGGRGKLPAHQLGWFLWNAAAPADPVEDFPELRRPPGAVPEDLPPVLFVPAGVGGVLTVGGSGAIGRPGVVVVYVEDGPIRSLLGAGGGRRRPPGPDRLVPEDFVGLVGLGELFEDALDDTGLELDSQRRELRGPKDLEGPVEPVKDPQVRPVGHVGPAALLRTGHPRQVVTRGVGRKRRQEVLLDAVHRRIVQSRQVGRFVHGGESPQPPKGQRVPDAQVLHPGDEVPKEVVADAPAVGGAVGAPGVAVAPHAVSPVGPETGPVGPDPRKGPDGGPPGKGVDVDGGLDPDGGAGPEEVFHHRPRDGRPQNPRVVEAPVAVSAVEKGIDAGKVFQEVLVRLVRGQIGGPRVVVRKAPAHRYPHGPDSQRGDPFQVRFEVEEGGPVGLKDLDGVLRAVAFDEAPEEIRLAVPLGPRRRSDVQRREAGRYLAGVLPLSRRGDLDGVVQAGEEVVLQAQPRPDVDPRGERDVSRFLKDKGRVAVVVAGPDPCLVLPEPLLGPVFFFHLGLDLLFVDALDEDDPGQEEDHPQREDLHQ
mmetsp:Transcript_7904/g.16302  ORF Transcript_7904/g.16302 Transcript_7904/m.16302 type:complete len:621 (+) Transcript_7904:594-2456(+)